MTNNLEDEVKKLVYDKDCRVCKYMGSDPDGAFCGHPTSLDDSAGFGLALHLARADSKICDNGALWERDDRGIFEQVWTAKHGEEA